MAAAVPSGGTVSASSCPDQQVLGFVPWYCGIDGGDDSEVDYKNVTSSDGLKKVVLGIAANVLTDLSVAASYLTLGWVIWGGYKYMFSRGDAGKVAEGKKTLTNAFIGLAIVMLSSVIFATIRGVIGAGTEKVSVGGVGNVTMGSADAGLMVTNMISWFMGMAGVVAVIFVVYGGISYITAAGDAGKIVKAKNAITYALIGLVIVAVAEVITGFVSKAIRESADTSMIYNNEMPVLAEENYEKTTN